ncbi:MULTISPECIES: WecB/TagA/CpsF family glycosyltransferase [unclassified Methylobacterium]|uniref:WecB/TagA/CpsF family glycosyltransferase n=1 Tax=unclassified Methylobacterium TaxID=2615210 RepID=UPI0009E8AB86|nr:MULTISPECIES: WecB/TagA/CpsF family glycosyltransferase [unclassified Methylobacterium]
MGLKLFGLDFTKGSAREVLAAAAAADHGRPRLVVTANMDHIISLSENAAFRRAYDGAAARTLDGMPLVWLALLRGQRDARRVTGHDILAEALGEPWTPQRRVFVVCASDRVADAARARILRDGGTPDAVAVAVPPTGFERDAVYGADLAQRVKAHGTTLLVMAVGAPRSEIWVDQHGTALGAPLVVAVGDALSVAAGLQTRAPVFMQRNGLEWLYRFAHDPRRLFHRYFVRSWRFLALIGTEFSDGRSDPPGPMRPKADRVSSNL